MFKVLLSGAAMACALAAGHALAAPVAAKAGPAPAWLMTPADNSCHTDIELTGRSGAIVPVALVSDGRTVELAFSKEEAPERAFLPVRVNQKAYSNLVVRAGNSPQGGRMLLSEETLAALRKGGALQIGWLADEPVGVSLSGSDQGLNDLKTCGAQVAAQYAQRVAAEADAKARAEAEARAKQLAEEQLAAVRAQREAAEAERERQAAEAEHQRALAAAEQARADQARQQQAYLDEQQRGYQPRPAYYDEPPPAPQPQTWQPQPRYYAPPLYGYRYRPAYGY